MLLSEVGQYVTQEVAFADNAQAVTEERSERGRLVARYRRPLGSDIQEFQRLISDKELSDSERMFGLIKLVGEDLSGFDPEPIPLNQETLERLDIWMIAEMAGYVATMMGGKLDLGESPGPSDTSSS